MFLRYGKSNLELDTKYQQPTSVNFPHACGELSVFGIHCMLVKTNPVNNENKNDLFD